MSGINNDERHTYGRHDGYDDGHDFVVSRPIEIKPLPYRETTQEGSVIDKTVANSAEFVKKTISGGW